MGGRRRGQAVEVILVLVVVGLWVASLAIDGSATFSIRDFGQMPAPASFDQARECTPAEWPSRHDDPWQRQWRAEGSMRLIEHERRGVRVLGRFVEVWARHVTTSNPVDGFMSAGTTGTDVLVFHYGEPGPYGFALQLPTPDAGRLCGFSYTVLIEGGNSTSSVRFATPAAFGDLDVGDSDDVSSTGGLMAVTVTRVSKLEWSIDARSTRATARAIHKVAFRLKADRPSPPWDSMTVEVRSSSLSQDVHATFELSPPVQCPNDNGLFVIECP